MPKEPTPDRVDERAAVPASSPTKSQPPELAILKRLLRNRLHPYVSGSLAFLASAIFLGLMVPATINFLASILPGTGIVGGLFNGLATVIALYGAYAVLPFYMAWLEPDAHLHRILTSSLAVLFWLFLLVAAAGALIAATGFIGGIGTYLATLGAPSVVVLVWATQAAVLRKHGQDPRSGENHTQDQLLNAWVPLFTFDLVSLVLLAVLTPILIPIDGPSNPLGALLLTLALAGYLYHARERLPPEDPIRSIDLTQDARPRVLDELGWITAGTLTLLVALAIPATILYILSTQLAFLSVITAALVGFTTTPWIMHQLRPHAQKTQLQLALLTTTLTAMGLYAILVFTLPFQILDPWHLAIFLPGLALCWGLTHLIKRKPWKNQPG